MLGDCAAYAIPRDECFSKISEKIPSFGLLPTRAKVDFIMHENTPHFVDTFIYRFLFKTYQIRAKLVDLTRPGEGPSGLDIL
jgi:hypothetical protein